MMTFELIPLDVHIETHAHLLTSMISLCAEAEDNLGYPLSDEVKAKLIQLFKIHLDHSMCGSFRLGCGAIESCVEQK